MLVLGRKVGERILVPQCGLSVTVVAIKGKTVRLAISAPDEIEIFREEIHRAGEQRHRPTAAG
jgi:carbon storage regulator